MPQMHWYQQLFTRRMLICVFTGFSSGLPLYLLLNLVPAWLKTEQIDLKAIGLLSLVQFPYTWKFIWSPLIDRYPILNLGRRRGWMLISQLALIVAIAALGFFSRHKPRCGRLRIWLLAWPFSVPVRILCWMRIVARSYLITNWG